MRKKYVVTRGCTWCNICVYECPKEAISMEAEGARINQDLCVGCGICYDNCASEAIEIIEVVEP